MCDHNHNQKNTTYNRKRKSPDNDENKQKWTISQANVKKKRKIVRIQYRTLANFTRKNRENIANPMTTDFMDKLEEQNKLYEDGIYYKYYLF